MNFSLILKKTWKFIWNDNSFWSWIVNIIIAFILVKFLIYPGIGLAMHTTHPVVAVVSGSMEHDGNFEDWWLSQKNWYISNGIELEDTADWNLRNGFNKGDIIFLKGTDDISVGDVIVFNGNSIDPIIHRVVKKFEKDGEVYFQTKGDHNSDSFLGLGELEIKSDEVIGKSLFKVPYLGWVKIGAVDFVRTIFRG